MLHNVCDFDGFLVGFIDAKPNVDSIPFHLWRYSPFWALPPSEDASILLYLLLVSSILLFLGSVKCPSGGRPPILFLVVPLVFYYKISQ